MIFPMLKAVLATKNTRTVWVPIVELPRAYRRLEGFISATTYFRVFRGQMNWSWIEGIERMLATA
jgi:hypothetical protein